MRFRLSLEELKSKVGIALKSDDLFADLKDVKIELRLSIGGPSRVNHYWKKLSFFQRIAVPFFSIFVPIVYTVTCVYIFWCSYPFTPRYLKIVQYTLFSIALLVILNLSFMYPKVKSKKDTFLLTMPSLSFLYLLPFQMEKSLLHELQHIRQGVRECVPSEKEASRIAKELLPTFLARVKNAQTD